MIFHLEVWQLVGGVVAIGVVLAEDDWGVLVVGVSVGASVGRVGGGGVGGHGAGGEGGGSGGQGGQEEDELHGSGLGVGFGD